MGITADYELEDALQQARKDARDKVLNQLEKRLKGRIKDNKKRQKDAWNNGSLDASKTYLLTCGEILSSVVDEIIELRQQAGE